MDKIYAYFKNISLLAIVDIATCLFLLVLAFMFFYHKRSLRVFLTLIGAIAAKVVIDALGVFLGNNAFALCSEVLRYFLLFLLVAVVVVYQSDLRSIFQRIATPHGIDLFQEGFGSDDDLHAATDELLSALQTMAKQNTGAIIIITPTTMDSNILETGTELNAKISAPLLVSIFNTKAPLHDGAVIVKGNKILSHGRKQRYGNRRVGRNGYHFRCEGRTAATLHDHRQTERKDRDDLRHISACHRGQSRRCGQKEKEKVF
ncbi:MAG: diadenylate cyclase [Clostridium sp.]|nr:diadenylate cyclase [Clostridium sp.]